MKKIYLRGKHSLLYARVDNADFDYLNQRKWYYHNLGYASNQEVGYMHRLINQTPRELETHHINHDKLDNQRKNLRSVSKAVNQANKPMSRNNTSGIPGVRWDKDRELWKVSFRWNKQAYNVGNFRDKNRAIRRLEEAMRNVRG